MSNYRFSEIAYEELMEHIKYIVKKDGIDRESNLYEQVIEKIQQIPDAPFEIGQRKDNYINGLRKVVFKRLFFFVNECF